MTAPPKAERPPGDPMDTRHPPPPAREESGNGLTVFATVVQELLDAGPEDFAGGVQEIDRDLRAEIRRLQGTRSRLARLAAGEHLALPQSVVDYLNRLRGLGVEERYLEMERAAWIMIAAQVPDLIDTVIAKKHEALDDPDMVKLYSLLRGALDWPADDPRVVEVAEVADLLERLMIRAVEAGEVGDDGFDSGPTSRGSCEVHCFPDDPPAATRSDTGVVDGAGITGR
ncbi:hypothetical protein [Streptomyces kaempferi]|uniref:hypothetical protein n=1 Tax=Streptomyces kaempferi TaxID=333725 RepID=UPI00361490A5